MKIPRTRAISNVAVVVFLAGMAGLAGYALGIDAASARDSGDTVTPIFTRKLDNAPGKSLTALVVDYAPGGGSPAHHHDESAVIFAYVVSGAVRSQVNDGEAAVYKAGQFFFEPPGAAHGISQNASDSEPARLLAVVVADDGATITTYDD